jgi:hypothetical protein
MEKVNIKYYFNIFAIIMIIVLSALVTMRIREEYPSIKVDYDTTEEKQLESIINGTNSWENNQFIKENTFIEKELFCSAETLILYPDSTRINEGDPMIIKAFFYFEEGMQSFNAGVNPQELISVDPGDKGEVIGFVYYKEGKNKIYIKHCYNTSYNPSISYKQNFEIERPSFVNSPWGELMVFFGTILLLGELYKLFYYFVVEVGSKD